MQFKSMRAFGAALLALGIGIGTASAQSTPTPPVYVVTYYEVVAASQMTAPQSTPLDILRKYRQQTLTEDGAVSMDVLKDAGRQNHYTVIEVWKNQSALTRHDSAASVAQLRKDVGPWLAGPKDQRVYAKFE
jgi:quinol monooxygenase YgiN